MQYGPKTMTHFSTIELNKNNNKNKPVVVFNSVLSFGKLRYSSLTYFPVFQCCFYKYLKTLTKLISFILLHLTDSDHVINLVT